MPASTSRGRPKGAVKKPGKNKRATAAATKSKKSVASRSSGDSKGAMKIAKNKTGGRGRESPRNQTGSAKRKSATMDKRKANSRVPARNRRQELQSSPRKKGAKRQKVVPVKKQDKTVKSSAGKKEKLDSKKKPQLAPKKPELSARRKANTHVKKLDSMKKEKAKVPVSNIGSRRQFLQSPVSVSRHTEHAEQREHTEHAEHREHTEHREPSLSKSPRSSGSTSMCRTPPRMAHWRTLDASSPHPSMPSLISPGEISDSSSSRDGDSKYISPTVRYTQSPRSAAFIKRCLPTPPPAPDKTRPPIWTPLPGEVQVTSPQSRRALVTPRILFPDSNSLASSDDESSERLVDINVCLSPVSADVENTRTPPTTSITVPDAPKLLNLRRADSIIHEAKEYAADFASKLMAPRPKIPGMSRPWSMDVLRSDPETPMSVTDQRAASSSEASSSAPSSLQVTPLPR